MTLTRTTPPLVREYAAMTPGEFAKSIEPRLQAAELLIEYVTMAVERRQLTPLDGAKRISSIAATFFGYDEFILDAMLSESLLTAPGC